MALTVSMTQTNPGGAVGDVLVPFVVTVSNGGAAALTLQSLCICEVRHGGTGTVIQQPVYLTPNMPVGLGNPVIAAGGSASYFFAVSFTDPNLPGPSPQNAPGGAAPSSAATGPDCNFQLQAQLLDSSGAVASAVLLVPVLSAGQTQAVPLGGAFAFAGGANLINGILAGTL